MVIKSKIEIFTRKDFKKEANFNILKKFARICYEEELETDYPYPVSKPEFFEKLYKIPLLRNSLKYYILYTIDNELKGSGLLSGDKKNNKHMMFTFIYVLRKEREKGIAKEILHYMLSIVPDFVKIISLSTRTDRYAPEYEKRINLLNKIKSVTGGSKHTSRRSVANLKNFDQDEIIKRSEKLKNTAENKGFNFIFVKNGDFQNKIFAEYKFIKLLESIDNDMPRENSSDRDIEFDKEMFYYNYSNLEELRRENWTIVAIERKTREPIGMTEVIILLDVPDVIFQGDTGVSRKFRGNNLGITLKCMMLKRILTSSTTSQAKFWSTNNARSNIHMIKINNELNHVENAIWESFEISKEEILKYLTQF